MNILDPQQLETLLRHPPKPGTPPGLKEKLIRQARSAARSPAPQPVRASARPGWLRRWWPVLAPAGFSLACAVVLAVQQMEIRDLKHSIETLRATTENVSTESKAGTTEGVSSANTSTAEVEELARLKEAVAKLTAEISQVEKLRAENQNLRARLAAPATFQLTPEEESAMQIARDRAMRINCVNNMKQLGLAARIWSGDHGDRFPVNVTDMSKEMNTPKILYCPGDTAHQPAMTFAEYSPNSNCSYEYLAPGGSDTEPTRVMFRCPIHNNLGMCDGSVQSIGNNPWTVQRDGKLYLEMPRDQ